VQDEIRYLESIQLTREGEHALLCFKVMLASVWRLKFAIGRFVALDKETAE
jgi:hypothetical protein